MSCKFCKITLLAFIKVIATSSIVIIMRWDVAFPIEGFTLDVIKPFTVDDVTFELHNPEEFFDPNQHLQTHQIKDIRILGVVRAVYGKDTNEIKSLAYQWVDRAVNIVQFIVPTSSLRTVDEVYFVKPLDNEGPVKMDNKNRFIALGVVTRTFSFHYSVAGINPGPNSDAQNDVKEWLKPFGAIRPDRKETLDKALSYYRIGVNAYNPFQAIESFFGAMQAIVIKIEDTDKPSEVIKDYIKPRIMHGEKGITEKEFYDKFGSFWGVYRSGGTHGKHHVNDYFQLPDVSEAKSEVERWTRIIIDDYIKDSSKP